MVSRRGTGFTCYSQSLRRAPACSSGFRMREGGWRALLRSARHHRGRAKGLASRRHVEVFDYDDRRPLHQGLNASSHRPRRNLRALAGEQRPQHFARVRLVVDDENGDACERDRDVDRRSGAEIRGAGGRGRDEGKTQRQGRPAAAPLALGAHRAAMQLHELANEGQANAETAVPPRGRWIRLAKPLENIGKEVFVDTFAGVSDRIAAAPFSTALDGDGAPFRVN